MAQLTNAVQPEGWLVGV